MGENTEDRARAPTRTSLINTIKTVDDAVASRDRAVIAVSLLCVFAIIAALASIVNALGVNVDDARLAADMRVAHFVDAAINLMIIAVLVFVAFQISSNNSRLAAIALLMFAILDAGAFALNASATIGNAPSAIIGIIIGGVARFFVLVSSANSLSGVTALARFSKEQSGGATG